MTDGTNTELVADIRDQLNVGSNPRNLTVSGSSLFFVADSSSPTAPDLYRYQIDNRSLTKIGTLTTTSPPINCRWCGRHLLPERDLEAITSRCNKYDQQWHQPDR